MTNLEKVINGKPCLLTELIVTDVNSNSNLARGLGEQNKEIDYSFCNLM